jgi:murein DD-endopeptidase MepM/ murein hydrolase activator NlpD
MKETVQAAGPPPPSMPGRMRVRLSLLALVVIAVPVALWALIPVGSTADSQQSLQSRIDHKEAQIGAKRRHEQVLTSDISAFTHRIDSLQGSITRLAARQERLQTSLDAERLQLARVQARLRAERLRLARLRARLLEARQVLAARLVQIYEDDRPDLVTVVLDANGFADLLERSEFMSRVSHQDAQIIEAVQTAKAQATASAKRLAVLEDKQTRVTAAIQSRRDQVASVKTGLQGTRDRIAGYRARKRALLASTISSRHKLEDDVAGLRSQQRKIEARLASAAGPAVAGPVRPGSGGLIWPVNGPITSPFCEARAWEACHPGIDIGVPSGTPIRAAAAGTVVLMQTTAVSGGYGNYTCIQHAGPLSTCYAHQERFAVHMGEHVAQGQIIGYTDCTGRCFGPHLHFETRINGQVVNPLNYL